MDNGFHFSGTHTREGNGLVPCESESHSVMPDSLQPHGLYRPWNSPGQNTGVGSLFLPPGDLPNPGIKPRSPASKADSLPAEPQGKPKNIGVGSLSLPQWIFLTQESNQGLQHCGRILYQLSYQGSSQNRGGIRFQLHHLVGARLGLTRSRPPALDVGTCLGPPSFHIAGAVAPL